MKQTLFILALITSTIQTFAQSPRIKLNQITKDSVTGSVLISSPTDSGMVYSRDLFISYGADTFLILGGDTLAATSGIISSVLSDGVTITGDGTVGSELTVDTATVIATKGDLSDYVTIAGTETISGTKTFSSTVTGTRFDPTSSSTTGNGMFLPTTNTLGFSTNGSEKMRIDASGTIGIGITPSNWTFFKALQVGLGGALFAWNSTYPDIVQLSANVYYDGQYKFIGDGFASKYEQSQGAHLWQTVASGLKDSVISSFTDKMTLNLTGLGIEITPSEKLDVNGNARFRSIGSGASAGALHYTSTGVLTTNTSDVRLKTNLQPLQNTLNKLLDINTYTFNWINETDRVDLGMVAQEVEEIFPYLVFTNSVDGYKGIHYDKFSSILTKAIQEQQAIIETQASEIEQLKTLITDLSNRLQILENN